MSQQFYQFENKKWCTGIYIRNYMQLIFDTASLLAE